ncbi:unnamed protein product [Clonostachys byssicola]|uniref:Uncharacterized protein n=1 Tax=Clonostachys byssicola TaxID=160290 RepID=A0A9N9UG57_9HYPO|nr:unnamed protein product [Clonostachys byssicola]
MVLVPSLLLVDTWIKQLEQHVRPGTLSVYKYHGQQRRLDASSPLQYDVVVSTYATVASDHNRGGGMLSRFRWYRLILDEAHVIRNWSTKQFNAVNSLSTNIRWCMTGTPIQNTIDDLGSLIKFLRVPQFSDTLVFRKHISGIKRIGQSHAKLNVANLRLLLSSMCLRRKQSVISLPGVTEVKHEVQFSEREKSAHKAILIACKKSAMASANQPNEKKSAKATLQGILRMRMFCNVGFEVGGSSVGEMSEPDQVLSLLQQSGDAKCYSCAADIHDLSENARISHCYSAACGECAPDLQSEAANGGADRNCPMCKKKCDGNIFLDASSTPETCIEGELPLPDLGRVWPSKLLAVLQDLKENLEKEKSIVFSFWRQSLDVVGRLLTEHNIAYCRVDGVLKPAHRKKVLEEFCSDDSLRVLLMTLGTGAVGLNDLSIASRVHFLEPQWNPSIESQAIGRVLRLGQEEEVCIVRYIVKGSIEKSVEDRQITKIRLAQAGEMHSAGSFSEAGLALIREQLDQIGEK